MALTDEVTSRYSAKRLQQLTNPGAPEGTGSIDTTRLGLAATDIEAEFETYCGVEYDGSEAQHVSVAVEGVIALLKKRLEHPDTGDWDDWLGRANSLSLVTGRDKVSPSTKSTIDPSDVSAWARMPEGPKMRCSELRAGTYRRRPARKARLFQSRHISWAPVRQ